MITSLERAIGCLHGIATGDAIGKQTEMLSDQDVSRWYPDGVRGFEGEVGAVIPRYVGNKKRAGGRRNHRRHRANGRRGARDHRREGRVAPRHWPRNAGLRQERAPGVRSLGSSTRLPIRRERPWPTTGAGRRFAFLRWASGPSHALRDLVTGAREASNLDSRRVPGHRRRCGHCRCRVHRR